MCFVHIVVNGSVFKVPAVALEAKNRIEPAKKKPAKSVAKPVDVCRPTGMRETSRMFHFQE